MGSTNNNILLVEDDLSLERVYREYLRSEPYTISSAENGQTAIDTLHKTEFDCVLLDLHLPDMNGFRILEKVREQQAHTPVIVITANGSIDTAVKAMQAGAADFILKPFKADRLRFTLRNVMERQKLEQIVETLRHDHDRGEYCGFVGKSLAMQEVYRVIERVAKSKATVFITGESGTGKEVSANAIHQQSARKNKPFIALNCGAIPKDLIESEIFGHIKGSFTGAVADRDGAATQADGGTLFLDEICEMDIDLQVKLLRFLQTDDFRRVGGSSTETADVRIVCATNRNPWEAVRQGRFREDLFYRLHVIPLHLPPLNEREDDVLDLARYFLSTFAAEEQKDFSAIEPEAERALQKTNWPGNVRELQNLIRNIVVLNDGPIVTVAMLNHGRVGHGGMGSGQRQMMVGALADKMPGDQQNEFASDQPPAGPPLQPLWQAERDLIAAALEHCDDNVQKAAGILEISPSTLYRRMRELKDYEN